MTRTLLEEYTTLKLQISTLAAKLGQAEEVLKFYADCEKSSQGTDGSQYTEVHVLYAEEPKALSYFSKKPS